MEKHFTKPSNNKNSRDILKSCVKDPAKFKTTPNPIYKTNILWKAYQYLVIYHPVYVELVVFSPWYTNGKYGLFEVNLDENKILAC